MRLTDFDYHLPPELIAQEPLAERQASRMMVVDRQNGAFSDRHFVDLPQLLRAGDVLVLNNTRVFPARLLGQTETGATVEIFLVNEQGPGVWEALARPAKRLKSGKVITFDERLSAGVIERTAEGKVVVQFDVTGDLDEILNDVGRTPLPPYIKRDASAIDADRERYQTVYARDRGAIAAPTAGLHFTPAILKAIEDIGVTVAEITLHVGYGTFEPVRVDDISQHSVTAETYNIDVAATEQLNTAKAAGHRIVAVGTTTTRALESNLARFDAFTAGSHSADLTITPGYRFRAVDALLTNFHLPQSSLLILTSTFGGHELIMESYIHAVPAGYRFYSYGDCMLIV
jgi:S-adenosylmethionine:tRNA ribosyltransferase-isomerase